MEAKPKQDQIDKAVPEAERDGKYYVKKREGATKYMSYCLKCKRVWEKPYKISGTVKVKIDYYTDFPTIGIKRKICPECKNLQEH